MDAMVLRLLAWSPDSRGMLACGGEGAPSPVTTSDEDPHSAGQVTTMSRQNDTWADRMALFWEITCVGRRRGSNAGGRDTSGQHSDHPSDEV